MPNWKKLITSGSAASLSSLTLDTALPVSQGGTGATTLTSNGILTGNGTSAIQAESELTYTGGVLDVTRTTGNAILQLRSNDSNPRIYFKEGATTAWNIGYSISNNRFEFYDGNTPFSIEDGAGSDTLVVDSNSRVGIGTASPTYELDVVGNAGIDGNLYHNGDTDTYLAFDTDRIRLIAGGSTKFDSNNTYLTSVDLTSDVTGTLPVANGGTGATTLTSNGILTGNGTSAIQAESNLTFDGTNLSIAAAGKIYLDGGSDTYIHEASTGIYELRVDNLDVMSADMNAGANVVFNDQQLDIDFRIESNNASHTFFVDAGTDRVGINTSGPSAKLHIDQDASEGALLVQGGGGGVYLARFQRDVGGTAYVDIHGGSDDPQITFTDSGASRQWSIGADSSTNSFKISENSSVGTNDRFTIDDSGRFGMGTTSPDSFVHISASVGSSTASLHVEGSGSEVFAVDGTNGRLFTVTDELSGSLFSANTIAGLPVIEAFSDYKVTLGPYSSQTTVDSSGNLSVSGEIRATGDVIAYYSSDERFKDNIQPIQDSLYKISKIGGYEYDWNDKQSTYEGHDVGVIAQEIHKVLPEVVTERNDGYLAVKYEKIVPLLIESIKELKQEVDDIKKNCKCLSDGNEL